MAQPDTSKSSVRCRKMNDPISVELLKQKLEGLKISRDKLFADYQAQNGAIQLCEHLIQLAESEAVPIEKAVPGIELVEKEK